MHLVHGVQMIWFIRALLQGLTWISETLHCCSPDSEGDSRNEVDTMLGYFN
jgi:hypothetical protein